MSSAPQPLNTAHDVKSLWARRLSASACLALTDRGFARYLDTAALPGGMRTEYRFPTKKRVGGKWEMRLDGWGVSRPPDKMLGTEDEARDEEWTEPCVYMAGNSLGLQNRRAAEMVLEEMDVWADRAVIGHFDHPYSRNWKDMGDLCCPAIAQICGARQEEVAVTGTLTGNLHTLMMSFYRPTKQRYKLMFEKGAFPSDAYAFVSQAEYHGLDPAKALVMLAPRPGEFILRPEDIIKTIKREGSSLALVLLPGVQYYTGQAFPIESITAAAQAQGALVGWDLAHAIGNVPLSLHAWNVDFAVWCSYKYLNSGPGGIGGLFVHERWGEMKDRPRLVGWWGHNPSTRFAMPPDFDPIPGARVFAHSNPSALNCVALISALELFVTYPGGMKALRARSEDLTGYLEQCLQSFASFVPAPAAAQRLASDRRRGGEPAFTVITPTLPLSSRGSQLSLLFLPQGAGVMQRVSARLVDFGVLGDEREPDVIRLAPTAMYSTFEDCRRAAQAVEVAMTEEHERWRRESQPVRPGGDAAEPAAGVAEVGGKSKHVAQQLQRRTSL